MNVKSMTIKKKINRRHFLKKATGIAAGTVSFPYFVPASALGKAGSTAPSNRITVGCIGLGARGTEGLKEFIHNRKAQVVALCDADKGSNRYYAGWLRGLEPALEVVNEHYSKQSPAGTYDGCGTYSDFRELLARDDIDAVQIATPDHWHIPISIAAAKAGKDIYCEKPLSMTIGQGRALCDAVSRYGRVFQTGSQGRSFGYMRKGCELVRNSRIGELKEIHVELFLGVAGNVPVKPEPLPDGFDYDMWLGPAPWSPYQYDRCHSRFRYNSDYSANGNLSDWGAHTLDFAQWGLGTDRSGPVEIEGTGRRLKNGLYDTTVEFDITYTYANGIKLFARKGGEKLRFVGTEGWVELSWGVNQMTASSNKILQSPIGPDDIRLYRSNDHIDNFLTCIKNRLETVAPAEVGHRSASMCHLGTIAMDIGQKLQWDPDNERFINNDLANKRLQCPAMRSPWRL
jgi:predicted dehydrogenase